MYTVLTFHSLGLNTEPSQKTLPGIGWVSSNLKPLVAAVTAVLEVKTITYTATQTITYSLTKNKLFIKKVTLHKMVCIRILPQVVHSQYIYWYKTNIRMRQEVRSVLMISIFQGMPKKYQDLIHLLQDSL